MDSMFVAIKVRRVTDRRVHERRQEQFLAEYAGHCESLHMRLTPKGCEEVRTREVPPKECQYCPGVDMEERRVAVRRSGADRRASRPRLRD